MPPLSTHFRLATLVLHQLDMMPYADSFLLGTAAPDAFESNREQSFSQHHFQAMDGRISLESFRKQTNFVLKPSNNSSWSFSCGYYLHLWLDVFYRDHADCIPVKKPVGMAETDLRKLLRQETEILNAPLVLALGNLQFPKAEQFVLPMGLEFVDLDRCTRLFYEVLKQSQASSQLVPTCEMVDAADYAAFFGLLLELFASEIKNAA